MPRRWRRCRGVHRDIAKFALHVTPGREAQSAGVVRHPIGVEQHYIAHFHGANRVASTAVQRETKVFAVEFNDDRQRTGTRCSVGTRKSNPRELPRLRSCQVMPLHCTMQSRKRNEYREHALPFSSRTPNVERCIARCRSGEGRCHRNANERPPHHSPRHHDSTHPSDPGDHRYTRGEVTSQTCGNTAPNGDRDITSV